MKRTLLVDTNRAAYPLYHALHELGHEVWVVGSNPDEPLAKLADHYEMIDYSDFSSLRSFVEKNNFDYLVPGCTDLSYLACSSINDGNYPGIDSLPIVHAINRKDVFRQEAIAAGVPVPKTLTAEQALNSNGLIIIKPVDGFSGRGITKLRCPNSSDLSEALQFACLHSASGQVTIEEFVEGQLYSCSAFLKNDAVSTAFFVQEDCIGYPFAVDLSCLATEFSLKLRESVVGSLIRLSKQLGISNGLFHIQFICDGERYWFIEATRRCPGDLYSTLINMSSGYNYAQSYVAPFIGQEISVSIEPDVQRFIIRNTLLSKVPASLWGLEFSRPLNIRLFLPLKVCGDALDNRPSNRAGIIFIEAKDRQEQTDIYRSIADGSLAFLSSKTLEI